jgi:hypothetical protein
LQDLQGDVKNLAEITALWPTGVFGVIRCPKLNLRLP